jgi:hypothetical protein
VDRLFRGYQTIHKATKCFISSQVINQNRIIPSV